MKNKLRTLKFYLVTSCFVLGASCSKYDYTIQEDSGIAPEFTESVASSGNTVSMLTYNIHRGKDRNGVDKLSDIATVIDSSGVDFVFLQEVDKNTVSSGGIDQTAWLASQISGLNYYAFEKHYDYDGGEYGLGILSKYPLSDIRNNRLTVRRSGQPNRTIALLTARAKLANGRMVSLASTHFSSDDKVEQANETIEYLRYYSNLPMILGGDLNSLPGSGVMDVMLGHFDDTENRYSSSIYDYFTFPAHNVPDSTYLKKIDYVLVDKAHTSSIISREVIKTPNPTRDHYPFKATVELKDNLFGEGNLLVMRYGNGTALSSKTTQIYVDEYSPSGTLIRTLNMPVTDQVIGGVEFNKKITGIGSGNYEGLMTLSRDGQSVSLMGYDLAQNVTVPYPISERVVGLISADGVINTYTSTSTDIGSTRCVASIDGSGFWAVGSKRNIRYLPMGSSGVAATDLGGPSGSRSIYLYDNNERLYLSTTISGGPRIARVGTGSVPPTSGTPTIQAFPGYPLTATSPNQFVLIDTGTNNTPDKLYVVDDSAGQILKYTYSGGWVAQGAVSVPGIKSITGEITSGTVTLYVTTIGSSSSVKKIVNPSGSTLAGATVHHIVSAPTNTVFKSIVFAPTF
ncbi:hypothetical protein F8C76_01785 [Flagellimonas olearia]|uniref:Endonuclease/exonuclease/phosphatase domain-containing protein n=1 Tax=Flagellimonas olearia TaxID=552546 RepID=A0A6I1DXP2_9FLAO|nr:endonuclease/exonuclease/phosphatase family protein [Allomuricauda olearia]KAB7530263.1 hypothetical protein F8C76_01785 [Allomuricauda olearia]